MTDPIIQVARQIKELEQERDTLVDLCCEAATVLERTAYDTLEGRNMADKLRQQIQESE